MFPEARDLSVIDLHEAATLMVRSGADVLCSPRSNAFESSLKAAAPTCGYAFECLSKLAFILVRYAADSTIPPDRDIRDFADGTYWTEGKQIQSMRGHHVEVAIRGLVDSNRSAFVELDRLLQEPFNRVALSTITAFHAFTRYAWVEDLRGNDEEVRFMATVFGLQQLHLADQPDEIRQFPGESMQHHRETFLRRVADALTDICFALTVGLYRILDDNNDVTLGRSLVKRLVGVFPERAEHLLGLTTRSLWGQPSAGAWGTYCF